MQRQVLTSAVLSAIIIMKFFTREIIHMKTVVYLGDSITDCGRDIKNGSTVSIGQGYALITSAELSYLKPGEYEFINTGVSGSRIVDIYSRIKTDCWNNNPDIISILIGINDIWHEIAAENGVDSKRFERIYSMLIEDTLERFPKSKFMLLEPFVLKGSATAENWNYFYENTRERAEITKRIAEKFNQTFIPLQCKFEAAEKLCPQPHWIADGVHPTPAGHRLIANEWLAAFERLEK